MQNLIKILSYKNIDFQPKLISDYLGLQTFQDTIDGQDVHSICGISFVIDFVLGDEKSCTITFVDEKLNLKLSYLNYYLNTFLDNKDYLFIYYMVRRIKLIDTYMADYKENPENRKNRKHRELDLPIKIVLNNGEKDSTSQVLIRRNGCFLCQCITAAEPCYSHEKHLVFDVDDYNYFTHRRENMVFRNNKMYHWVFRANFDSNDTFNKINYKEINYEMKSSVVIGDTEVKMNGDILYKGNICKKRRFLMKNGVTFEEMSDFFNNCY